MLTPLTQQVLAYQQLLKDSDKTSKEVQEQAYQSILNSCRTLLYTYPVKVRVLQPEEAIEFLFMMESRLKNLITTFHYERISFESYVKKVAYMQSTIMLTKLAKKERRHRSLFRTCEEVDEQLVADQSIVYGSEIEQNMYAPAESQWDENTPSCQRLKRKIAQDPVFKKRFLYLVLLCSDELNSTHIPPLCRLLGMKEEVLADLLAKVHELSAGKRDKRVELSHIRNSHYHTCQFLKQELFILNSYCADPLLLEKVERRLTRETTFLRRSQQELRSRPNTITHATVGMLLNIPKGSVDSGLHALKKTLRALVDA